MGKTFLATSSSPASHVYVEGGIPNIQRAVAHHFMQYLPALNPARTE